MNGDKETVTISKKEYDSLLDSSNKLNCLENGGVDNWEWYYESLKQGGYFEDEEDEDEDEDED
ncbi:hypothetical protein [Ochrobactrum sp. BTU1]|uniref:hypothetical protein n=1 Tax=Ochrobactrum sp. BTU1 TaxID=2840456 RepID=UPI001C045EE0|nr:hypothetical protein KMS41_05050 [Ochrobactrum sp. BTU1]